MQCDFKNIYISLLNIELFNLHLKMLIYIEFNFIFTFLKFIT
jgi:hypothetical protein